MYLVLDLKLELREALLRVVRALASCHIRQHPNGGDQSEGRAAAREQLLRGAHGGSRVWTRLRGYPPRPRH
eukprot:5824187-Prymnesium_polylepis.1